MNDISKYQKLFDIRSVIFDAAYCVDLYKGQSVFAAQILSAAVWLQHKPDMTISKLEELVPRYTDQLDQLNITEQKLYTNLEHILKQSA